jgi:RNA polymerase sigma-70 factor (ECF subfamily)
VQVTTPWTPSMAPPTTSSLPSPVLRHRGLVDDDPIRTFVNGEYRQVVATVALVCGSVPTAEDSVQEALARAWERIERGDPIDRLAAWVTTVALNLAKSQMRRWRCERRARVKLGALRPEAPDAPGASAEAHAVREALKALPRRQREVTALRYYLGLDVREIAEELGIAEGTVKAMLFRARQSLAIALGDEPTDALIDEPADEEVQRAD